MYSSDLIPEFLDPSIPQSFNPLIIFFLIRFFYNPQSKIRNPQWNSRHLKPFFLRF